MGGVLQPQVPRRGFSFLTVWWRHKLTGNGRRFASLSSSTFILFFVGFFWFSGNKSFHWETPQAWFHYSVVKHALPWRMSAEIFFFLKKTLGITVVHLHERHQIHAQHFHSSCCSDLSFIWIWLLLSVDLTLLTSLNCLFDVCLHLGAEYIRPWSRTCSAISG